MVAPGCGVAGAPEDGDGGVAAAITAYVAVLPPLQSKEVEDSRGSLLFASIGCAGCHVSAVPAANGAPVRLCSALLIHDMGPLLEDGVARGKAGGRDWRTPPLWGLGARSRLPHEGRAITLTAALLAPNGQGDPSGPSASRAASTCCGSSPPPTALPPPRFGRREAPRRGLALPLRAA